MSNNQKNTVMKLHKLSFKAVSNPATYVQVSKLMVCDNVTMDVSLLELMKRLDSDDCDGLIREAEAGEEIEIRG